jgi:hypothetical protein
MTVEFENDKEAFIGVLSLVMGADQVGSLTERDFMFERVKKLRIFSAVDKSEFGQLLESVTNKVFEALRQEGGGISPAGVDSVLDAARAVLDPELRKTLLTTARELCESDETTPEEAALLSQLRRKLGG